MKGRLGDSGKKYRRLESRAVEGMGLGNVS